MLRIVLAAVPLLSYLDLLRGHESYIASRDAGQMERSFVSAPTLANLPLSEMESLEDLYDSTNGTNWNWNPEITGMEWDFSDPNANPCTESWQGITCSAGGGEYRYVVEVDLSKYGLLGPLPESLSNLTMLETFSAGENTLTGTIPASLGSLSELRKLEVGVNKLRGGIPASLGNLTNLENLELFSNRLTGSIPASLGNLTNLQILYLSVNRLRESIPSSVGNLVQLQRLDVSKNVLTGAIPAALGNLSQLQFLDVSSNALTGAIPDSLGNLSQLWYLDVDSNMLSVTIPDTLGSLSQLVFMYMSTNQFTGSIPASFGNLTQLQILEVATNKLSGTLPATLGNLTKLVDFDAYSNRLSGPMPASLGGLSQLVNLDVDTNKLSGSIPASFGNLSQLQYLVVYSNKLSGTLPATLGNLSQLIDLAVYSNVLTGTIPASLGNLSQLLDLNMISNRLSGTVPDTFGGLHLIVELLLDDNRLTGTLPVSLGQCAHLQYLTIPNNALRGAIPDAFGNLGALFELSLDSNFLSGTIPRSLAQVATLNSFIADHNSLSGSLDGVFDAAVQADLSSIVVNNNQLIGTIPSEIFDLPSLSAFVASTNCFHGQLPNNICSRPSVVSIVLDGLSAAPACKHYLLPGLSRSYILENAVHGTVPSCLFQLPKLSTLHLSGNGFTGSILSDSTAVSPRLVDLSLSHNYLTGTIPPQLQNKTWAALDFSFNRLRGSLPSSMAAKDLQVNVSNANTIGNKQMSLFLENNRLSGRIPHSVQSLQNVSILGTNIFSCKLDGSDLPQHDSGVSNYQCGSSEFDVPYYVWLGLCCLSAVLIACAVRLRSSVLRFVDIEAAVSYSRSWWHCVEACGVSTPMTTSGGTENYGKLSSYVHIKRFCQSLDTVSKHAAMWTAVILVVLLPLYATLSHYYGTHLQAYAWTVSAAYLSGAVPFGLEMVLWIAILVASMGSMLYCCAPYALTRTEPSRVSSINSHQLVLIYTLFLGINIVIVGGVNVAYVYVSIYRSSQLLTFMQIAMSFFKVIYNGVASAYILRYIVRKVTGEELQTSAFASLRALSALVNNIVIPFGVVLVVSPSCFYSVFDPAPSVSAISSFEVCNAVSGSSGACIHYVRQPLTSTYDPPFTYSYQCSSSLITYYAPAFVNLCVVSLFVMPMVQLLAVEALRRADKSTRWFQLLDRAVPTTWKLPVIGETLDTARTYFNPLREQLAQLNFAALILTFGVVFPPLAAALAVTLVVCTVITKLKLGRLLQHVCDHDGGGIAQSVELACESLLSSALLRDFVGMLSVIACLFYTLFLFDTVGDAVGFHKAYWVLIVAPLLPVCAICAHWAFGTRSPLYFVAQESDASNRAMDRSSIMEMAAATSEGSGAETFNVILSARDAKGQQ